MEGVTTSVSEITKQQYEEYLQTGYWQRFSYEIRRDRRVCERCGCGEKNSFARYKQKLHIHHKTYERLWHELPEDVELLCFDCHLSGAHGSTDPEVSWKIICAKFAMPAEKIQTQAICVNCQKAVAMSVWNLDELNCTDGFYCWECS